MVMAARTLHPHTEKDLAEECRQRRRLAARAIDHRRADAMRAALGRKDFAHHLVVRLVGGEALANPVVDRVCALAANARDVRPEQVTPAVGPRVGIRRIVEQPVNQLGAFVRRLVGEETPRLARLRQQADHVNEGPPHELRVAASLARQQTQFLKTRIRQVVDEIVARQPGVNRVVELPIRRHGDPRARHLPHVTHHDNPFVAEPADAHPAGFIHLGDLLFVRRKIRQVRHVPRRAIRESRGDNQLLLCRLGVALLIRENRNAAELRFVRPPVKHPLRNPVVNDLIKRRADFKPFSALMLDSKRWFFEHQALRR